MSDAADRQKKWANTQLDAARAGINVPAWAVNRALWILGDLSKW